MCVWVCEGGLVGIARRQAAEDYPSEAEHENQCTLGVCCGRDDLGGTSMGGAPQDGWRDIQFVRPLVPLPLRAPPLDAPPGPPPRQH